LRNERKLSVEKRQGISSVFAVLVCCALLILFPTAPIRAQATAPDDWIHKWLQNVDETRASQPHNPAPLITTHVLLVQQFRFDSYWQEASNRTWSANYGASKGLEIIPNRRMEVQVSIPPPYMVHPPGVPDGFGDVSIFLKFRAFSATEGKGDYFLGAFSGVSFPSGNLPNGMGHTVFSPMLAASKGWGHFDVQSTLSGSLPASGTNVLGRSILFNNAFQYNVGHKLWPEVEVNSTFFRDGPLAGKNQAFLTPGLLVSNFRLAGRLRFAVGTGVQIAATQFHTYNHRWVLSARFPF
jgi:hypothetical protein